MIVKRRVHTKHHHQGRTKSTSSYLSKRSKSFPDTLSRKNRIAGCNNNNMFCLYFNSLLSLLSVKSFVCSSATEVIGSGHFGEVDKGQWRSVKKNATLDVALKTLPKNEKTEDKLKLLQEATIMGQFSHPNVVQLYGIVSFGQPVSIESMLASAAIYSVFMTLQLILVMEYMAKRDLKKYLLQLKPQ